MAGICTKSSINLGIGKYFMAKSEANDKGTKFRNYSIAAVCLVFAVLIIAFGSYVFANLLEFSASGAIWTNCNQERNLATVFITANDEAKNVKCVAMEKEFFSRSEISLGDLSRGDRDACKFKLDRNVEESLRFEIHYNGKVRKEVCNSPPAGFMD